MQFSEGEGKWHSVYNFFPNRFYGFKFKVISISHGLGQRISLRHGWLSSLLHYLFAYKWQLELIFFRKKLSFHKLFDNRCKRQNTNVNDVAILFAINFFSPPFCDNSTSSTLQCLLLMWTIWSLFILMQNKTYWRHEITRKPELQSCNFVAPTNVS